MVCVDSRNMATTENAESGLPENKGDRADPDAKYPLKVLYCGGEKIHEFFLWEMHFIENANF